MGIPFHRLDAGLPFKAQISRSLKRQTSGIAFCQQPIFPTAYGKLHTIAAFHLKCDVIACRRRRMESMSSCHISCIRMLMMGYIHAFRHDKRLHRQLRRLIVPIPLRDPSAYRHNETDYYNRKYDENDDSEDSKIHKHAAKHTAALSFPILSFQSKAIQNFRRISYRICKLILLYFFTTGKEREINIVFAQKIAQKRRSLSLSASPFIQFDFSLFHSKTDLSRTYQLSVQICSRFQANQNLARKRRPPSKEINSIRNPLSIYATFSQNLFKIAATCARVASPSGIRLPPLP